MPFGRRVVTVVVRSNYANHTSAQNSRLTLSDFTNMKIRNVSYGMKLLFIGALATFAVPLSANDENEHGAAVTASINAAGFGEDVGVTCTADQAMINSDT